MIAPNINIFSAGLIIDFLIKQNINLFCISPGSRSTPLALAVVSNKKAKAKLFYDERAAAYYALSYSRGCGRPVGLICTSGTAVANYFPGLIEARQSLLPVAVLTADRPKELQNCGANQTIDQTDLFGKFVSKSITLEAPDEKFNPHDLLDLLNFAICSSNNFDQPVHINCRFREPLSLPEASFDASIYDSKVEKWYDAKRPEASDSVAGTNLQCMNDALDRINRAKHGIIISGPASSSEDREQMIDLAQRLNWPVFCDVLSTLKSTDSDNLFDLYDLYLDETEGIIPDLVIHIGGLPTSKRLNHFLLAQRPASYIKIQSHNITVDPDRLETIRIVGPTAEIISKMLIGCEAKNDNSWLGLWKKRESLTRERLTTHFHENNASEPALAFALPEMLPDGSALFLSNSMPIRDADSFGRHSNKNIIVAANRGVSGIDGIIASACGFAEGCQRPTTLVIGDLAFIHDMNSLILAARSNFPIRIIVINNDGGGIFHFLPVAEIGASFEPLFGTPHGMNFQNLSGQFGLPYESCDSVPQLKEHYHSHSQHDGSFIIEIKSNRVDNHEQHQFIRRMIAEQLSERGD